MKTFRHALMIFTLTLSVSFVSEPANATSLLWDQNAAAADQTDGSGTWLSADQWWNGGANVTWDNSAGDDAVIGNGGNGGNITVGAVTNNSIVFTNFSGTYTLSGDTASYMDVSTGVTTTPDAGKVTITKRISGTGGLTVNHAPGTIVILNNPQNNPSIYTGPTKVTGGILQVGTSWHGAQSIPGGVSSLGGSSGSDLELNGGTVTLNYYLRRSLGNGPGQLQLTGGASGFNHMQSDTYGRINISNTPNYEIVWGSDYFKPDALVLNAAGSLAHQVVNIQNKIDLNGADRTVACNSTKTIGPGRVDANNGFIDTAGGRLTGIIRNSGATPAGLVKIGPGLLNLTAANTYDGDTRVEEGTLDISASSALPSTTGLWLAAGSTNNLRSGVNATIAYLQLDGKSAAVGTWGSTSSAATNQDDTYFTGDGILTVLDALDPAGTVIYLK